MNEYIDRKRAVVDACNSLELFPSEYEKLEEALNKIPAADVELVRHGKWVPVSDDDQDEGQFHCSICDAPEFFPCGIPLSRYCYNCGAKMDGKDDAE